MNLNTGKDMTMKKDSSTASPMTRRRLLARVGMVAGAVYVVPTMIGLNAAHASGNSGASGGSSGASGGNSGASGSGNSGASQGGNSGASRGRNSHPSRNGQGNREDLPPWLRRLLQGT
jgi:hypothetical protein